MLLMSKELVHAVPDSLKKLLSRAGANTMFRSSRRRDHQWCKMETLQIAASFIVEVGVAEYNTT